MQPKKSALCITGFILSLVQFCTLGFLSPLSMILSICGVVACRGGRKGGKGLGIAGIIISIFGLLFMTFWLTMMGTTLDKYKDAVKNGDRNKRSSYSRVDDEDDKDDKDDEDDEYDEDEPDYDEDEGNKISKSFGSYEISSDWVEANGSSDDIYYCYDGRENDSQPNNIRVFHDSNKYTEDQILEFKEAIQTQLLQQVAGSDVQLTGSGWTTNSGLEIIQFNIEPNEEDGSSPIMCTQYYIVGDKEYVMVSLMIWDKDADEIDQTEECAEKIVNTFEWG